MTLILASSSPRRRQFLCDTGLSFEIQVPDVHEEPLQGETPEELVLRLARAKARNVSERRPQDVVLAADTVVVLGDTLLGKPASTADAARMLRQLSGNRHRVLTGVCVMRMMPAHEDTWMASTTVQFKELSPSIISEYIEKVHVLDKAGAYAIQEHGELIIDCIDGLYSNVVGLPVEQVLERLEGLIPLSAAPSPESSACS